MKITTLKQKIISSFLAVIFVMSFFIALFRIYVIKINIIERAQNEVKNNLKAARTVYANEIDKIKLAFSVAGRTADLSGLKEKIGLDYLYVITPEEQGRTKSEIVARAFLGNPTGGTRIIEPLELAQMDRLLPEKVRVTVRQTPLARPTSKKELRAAMALEYAMPLADKAGKVNAVMYGGSFINNNFRLVDTIHDLVFENRMYDQKPVGTVTIFQDDVRISTNVLDAGGKRAVGTQVSEKVYDTVVKQDKIWVDRAFVVTDWYLTAYEPIKDVKGNTIGILYVGILEKPFNMMTRNVLLGFLAIILFVVTLAVILAFLLAASISKPLTGMVDATSKISSGDLNHTIKQETSIRELDQLALAFNRMVSALNERDKSLKVSNDKLAALNKSYLDLIGFVAHELKGILSSTILNAYTVRDGFVGMINFKQRKALDSVVRNLDYFSSTIRNFLNLSRIEKGEMSLRKTTVLLKEDIFEASIDAVSREAAEKEIQIINNLPGECSVCVDIDLLQIVTNNLIVNAIKYGIKGGSIILDAVATGARIQVEVYNDGTPLKQEDIGKLFKKFSRLATAEAKKERGTGLGLFVAREIIEQHGGTIKVEPREAGNSFIFEIPI